MSLVIPWRSIQRSPVPMDLHYSTPPLTTIALVCLTPLNRPHWLSTCVTSRAQCLRGMYNINITQPQLTTAFPDLPDTPHIHHNMSVDPATSQKGRRPPQYTHTKELIRKTRITPQRLHLPPTVPMVHMYHHNRTRATLSNRHSV